MAERSMISNERMYTQGSMHNESKWMNSVNCINKKEKEINEN